MEAWPQDLTWPGKGNKAFRRTETFAAVERARASRAVADLVGAYWSVLEDAGVPSRRAAVGAARYLLMAKGFSFG